MDRHEAIERMKKVASAAKEKAKENVDYYKAKREWAADAERKTRAEEEAARAKAYAHERVVLAKKKGREKARQEATRGGMGELKTVLFGATSTPRRSTHPSRRRRQVSRRRVKYRYEYVSPRRRPRRPPTQRAPVQRYPRTIDEQLGLKPRGGRSSDPFAWDTQLGFSKKRRR